MKLDKTDLFIELPRPMINPRNFKQKGLPLGPLGKNFQAQSFAFTQALNIPVNNKKKQT
jgi:hypothetical protein